MLLLWRKGGGKVEVMEAEEVVEVEEAVEGEEVVEVEEAVEGREVAGQPARDAFLDFQN